MPKTSLADTDQAKALLSSVVQGMQNKKAFEIVTLDLRNIEAAQTDFMAICHASSDTHAEAIARAVEEHVLDVRKEKPWHIEGLENKEWILLDYVDVLVHIFLNEKRAFFNLEELWGDAGITRHDYEH